MPVTEAPPAIEAFGLRRTYTTRTGFLRPRTTETEAVRGIDLQVARGELFGLLGPNGAGRTTTIKMLNTLLLPTSGTARVLGHDVAREPVAVRRRVGYVFGGDRGLYDRLTALDNLRCFAELHGVEPRDQRRRIAELLEPVGLLGREKPGEGAGGGLLARYAAAPPHRPGPAPPARCPLPGRALDRRRPGRRPRSAPYGGRPPGRRHHRAPHHPLHGRGRRTVRPDRGDRGRHDPRPRHPRPAQVPRPGTRRPGDRGVRGGRRTPRPDPRPARRPGRGGRGARLPPDPHRAGGPGADPHAPVLAALSGIRIGRVVTREPTLGDAYIAIVEEAEAGVPDGEPTPAREAASA
nr:ATP-binding cassette domain-containing protein [Streptomyces sp. SID8374]